MNTLLIFIIIILIFLLLSKSKKQKRNITDTLVRQAARWSLAAEQDESPLIAVLHANYGAAYLWAAKDLSTSEEISKVAGIDSRDFEKKIVDVQDIATTRMSKLCPEYIGDSDKLLMAIAGDA